jgi:hypothetical protein
MYPTIPSERKNNTLNGRLYSKRCSKELPFTIYYLVISRLSGNETSKFLSLPLIIKIPPY